MLTCTKGGPVVHIGCLPEGAVCAADIMVVPADDNGPTQPALIDGLVEGGRDGHTAALIGIQDARLGANDLRW